jgi:hypothetical protein
MLYRGISVSWQRAAETISEVHQNGLLPGQGRRGYLFADLKPQLESLWHLPNLTTAHTKPTGEPPPWVGACADLTGAAYYALKHNRSSEPELGFRPGNITYMTPRQAASRERNPIPEETKRAIRKALRKGRSVYSIARRYDVGEKRVREMRDER